MKKISTIILIFTFILNIIRPILANAASYDNIGIASASLNTKTGLLIAGKNQNTILPLASLTKLMTALILIDLKINFNKKVIITQSEINYTLPYIAQGDKTSQINLKVGDEVTNKDLWNAMLIASSNEAAIALVDNSGLTRAQFVKRMNSKAKALGLKNTFFTEPSGIDPNNTGTAKEMAIIARDAYSLSTIRLVGISSAYKIKEINSGRSIGVYNRNNSLLAMKPLGMKVGYLTEAKDNVAIRLVKSGLDRIIVVLHANNNASRNAEIKRLITK